MAKVSITDRRIRRIFASSSSWIFAAFSTVLLFVDIPANWKIYAGILTIISMLALYVGIWLWSNNLNDVTVNIEGSSVNVKAGNIFDQPGFKAIAFNEYFDTIVDDKLIASSSLNGDFILNHSPISAGDLNNHIKYYQFDESDVLGHSTRSAGNSTRYRLGTICVLGDYLLTAFSRFDESNRAVLSMPEYLEFLINFWDKVNRVYAQKSVSTTIFGSGITRIKNHRNISDEDLLKIMLWTFRISEMRFKYPAKLTIVVHKDKIDQINLLDVRAVRNGL